MRKKETSRKLQHQVGIGHRILMVALTLLAPALLGLKANTWQARLDKAVLSIDLEPRARFRLFQRAISDPELSKDLTDAAEILRSQGIGKGHPAVINKLWPTGTTARADLEGLTALRTQLPEAVAELQKAGIPHSPPDAPPPPDPATVLSSLVSLVTDTKKQEELIEEAKDNLRRTPKSLETPEYTVVRTLDGPDFLGEPEPIEIRSYEEFKVARMPIAGGFGSSAAGAEGFQTLAAYLFGGNEQKENMAMTTPVETRADSMSFVLPRAYADAPPAPLASSKVEVGTVPARLVAAKPFAGLVTDDEISRQKAKLIEVIKADASLTMAEDVEVSVLQYNGPFTIPWRRRNEVAIVVEEAAAEGGVEAEVDGGVVSWYDSGVRL